MEKIMDNISLLKEMGFFEKDGWLCNPKLEGEAIFKIGDPVYGAEDKPLSWVMSVISASAFNAGTRWQEEDSKNQLVKELEGMIKKIKKS